MHPIMPPPPMPRDAEPAASPTDIIERVLELNLSLPEAKRLMVAEFERRYIARVLASQRGNVTRAAAVSGIARQHFYRIKAKCTSPDALFPAPASEPRTRSDVVPAGTSEEAKGENGHDSSTRMRVSNG